MGRAPTAGGALVLAAWAAGCATPPGEVGLACHDDPVACVDPDGAPHPYLVDQLRVPTTAVEAVALASDVDGDPEHRRDNQLGTILATVQGVGRVDVQAKIDGWLADATVVLMVELTARDLDQASGVGGRLFYGAAPSPAACRGPDDVVCGQHLHAGTSVARDDSAAVDFLVPGTIVDGRFKGGPARTEVELRLPDVLPRPLTLDVIGVRTRSTVAADGLDQGLVAGAIRLDEVRREVLPMIVEIVARDCRGTPGACCTPDTAGDVALRLFDPGADCALTLPELEADGVLQALIEPDVDLLDEGGAFAPRRDGIKDAISLGLGFHAVPARLRGGP